MSSKTLTELFDIALIAAAIAVNVIPGVGQVLSAAMITAITAAGIGAGLSLAETALMSPASPSANTQTQVGRLYATLATTAPRKIVAGHTAMATDIRYDTYTGANQEYYHQIIACAAHKVHSIDEIWIDNEKAWSSAGGVQGRYVGYLTVQTVLEGNSSNGIAIDGNWTSSCTLTGCAYVYLQYLLVGPDSTTSSPFQGGLSNRLTIRGKGAPVYDPRLDSTVPGGSGAQRADDQTTWAWDDNASRNPALQELFYELGWRINGKLSVGKGLPPERLDRVSYITAANICDEAVALKAGGTEPRYRCDGVASEGDESKTVRDSICATMNAELRDNGSAIGVQILCDDLADIAVDFTASDIVQDGDWQECPPISQCFNVVRGQCTDPSDNALYQQTDYPEWSASSPDGIDRIFALNLPMVESTSQAQRLAKLKGMRFGLGQYSPSMGPRAWRTSVGRNVTITHPVLPWTGKVFRTATQKISRSGPTALVLAEESSAIYAWNPATDEKDPITALTPVVYDPANNPLLSGTSAITQIIRTSNPSWLGSPPVIPSIDSTGVVTIPDHNRVYSDKTVAVTGGTVTAASVTAGDTVAVFYDQADRSGGAVTYQTLTVPSTGSIADALASDAHPYRHFVTTLTIPSTGSSSGASGGGAGYNPGSGPYP